MPRSCFGSSASGWILTGLAESFFQGMDQMKKLYELFLKVDATQVEINPFAETPDGQGTMVLRSPFFTTCDD